MALRKRDSDREEAAITRTPGIMGGSPCIAGHRIRVADVVRRWKMNAGSDQMAEVLSSWPQISREQIEMALRYYTEHEAEIDEYIAEEDALYKKALADQRRSI